jgi:hypothetical protein
MTSLLRCGGLGAGVGAASHACASVQYLADMADEADGVAEADDDAPASFEASFASELAALRSAAADAKPLQAVHTKLDCVVIFRAAPSVHVTDLILRILHDIQRTKTLRTRFALARARTARAACTELTRLVGRQSRAEADPPDPHGARAIRRPRSHGQDCPLPGLSPAGPAGADGPSLCMSVQAQPGLTPALTSGGGPSMQYAIQFNARSNTSLTRDGVIPRLAAVVGDRHRVQLDAPELTILVEAYQVRPRVCAPALCVLT